MNVETLPDDEFHRCWASKGGETAALKRAAAVIDEMAAAAFTRNQDQIANSLRDCAAKLHNMHNEARKELDSYIKESRRRGTKT